MAIEAATEEINNRGGIEGKPLRLIVEDSKGCDSQAAVTIMQKLVSIDRVEAVYSLCSNVALAVHSIAESNKVVHFGCASNPKVRELGDYMFRIIASDDFAG